MTLNIIISEKILIYNCCFEIKLNKLYNDIQYFREVMIN